MKTGIIVDNEFLNDIRVRREAEILKSEGYDVHVLCLGFSDSYPDPMGFNITRIRIRRRIKDTLFFFQNLLPAYEWIWSKAISRFIRLENPEIIHVHDLYMSRAAYRGIKKTGRKIRMILDLHENYPFQVTTYNWTKGFFRKHLSRPEEWKKKEQEYLGYADKIIVLSHEYGESLRKKYPWLSEDRFIVFPNVPDINSPEYHNVIPVEKPFSNGYPILLYYGVIAERRGIFETLDVFSGLIKNNHNVNLLLIGPLDKQDRKLFYKLISSDQFKGRLIHIPWINSSDFPGYLAISDICLAPLRKNPQHESGIANKIYDYMLGGKPLVVSDCAPQKNLVEKYKCGIVFSDKNQFSEAIALLLNDETMRKSMGHNGQFAIANSYNISNLKGSLLAGYNLEPQL